MYRLIADKQDMREEGVYVDGVVALLLDGQEMAAGKYLSVHGYSTITNRADFTVTATRTGYCGFAAKHVIRCPHRVQTGPEIEYYSTGFKRQDHKPHEVLNAYEDWFRRATRRLLRYHGRI